MILPFENLTGLDRDRAPRTARAMIADSRIAPFFAEEASKGLSHWFLAEPSRRSENYHDHSWDMVEPLLVAYSDSGDVEYLEASCRLALQWCEVFSSREEREAPVGERHMAWYDMAVGLRAYRLAYILDAAGVAGILTELERERLWSSLMLHAEFLADDDNIIFHNNHGFFQAAGQLAMGRRFAERSEIMAKAKQLGEARFHQMLDAQFSSEGVHLEHSPDYHRMVHRTARAVVAQGLIEDPETIDFVTRIEKALSWFVLPDRRIANVGDSDSTYFGDTPSTAVQRWTTDEMRFVSTGGQAGARPDVTHRTFPEGGYLVARIPDAQDNGFEYDSYILQQAGFHSRTHKHADTLSFIWYDRGKPILIDAGRYGYVGKTDVNSDLHEKGFWYSDPYRIYCETTRAHNCLEFDGVDYPRRGMPPPGSLVGRTTELSEQQIVAFETEAQHFDGLTHVRMLFLRAGRWLICVDWYQDGSKHEHDAVQWFHFAPDLTLLCGPGSSFVEDTDARAPLRVIPLLQDIAGVQHSRGESVPEMQGWWSPASRKMEENDAVGYRVARSGSAAVATLFTFSAEASADLSKSRVSANGREGSLRWLEDGQTHQLRFVRPADGALKLDYRVDRE